MPDNFPGPYEVEMFYTSGALIHVAKYNCDIATPPTPGDPASSIDLKTRGGGSVQLDTAVDAWVDLLRVNYPAASTFDTFNLWKYAAGTFDRTFITTDTITKVGSSGSNVNTNHQFIFTFRTLEGGTMRIHMMDDVNTDQDKTPYVAAGGATKPIMDFVISTDDWILARDTSYPIAGLHELGGQNEKLFKIRNR